MEFIFSYTFLGVGMIQIFSGTTHIYWAKWILNVFNLNWHNDSLAEHWNLYLKWTPFLGPSLVSTDTLMPFDATYYVLYVKIDVPLDKLLIIPENIHVTPSVGGFMVWSRKFQFCLILSFKTLSFEIPFSQLGVYLQLYLPWSGYDSDIFWNYTYLLSKVNFECFQLKLSQWPF